MKRLVVLSLNSHIPHDGAFSDSICIMSEFSVEADDLQNILENHYLYKYFKISFHIHIILGKNQNDG